MMVISPYAKRGYVDDAFGEFTAPLRFISDNWGLPPLTSRIEQSHNFEHVFDFDRKPRAPEPLPHVKATNRFWDWPEDFAAWPPSLEPDPPDDPLPLTPRQLLPRASGGMHGRSSINSEG